MDKPRGIVGKFIVDIDVGGTFTDAIVSGKSGSLYLKVETTPHELSQCLQDALEGSVRALNLPDLKSLLLHTQVIRLSTSLSTNSLVEGRGAQCGLIVPRGGRERYVSQLRNAESSALRLVEDMIAEVSILHAALQTDDVQVSEDEVRESIQMLVEQGASIIVVSLVGGDLRAEAEERVKKIITRFYPRHFMGSLPVLLSSQISSSPDFLERTNTAVLNAYCHRAMVCHFSEIEDYLRDQGYTQPLLVVHCTGGSARVAKTRAVLTINSGAAAGVFGVSRLARKYELENVVSVDVGGTTTEIGVLLGGDIDYTPRPNTLDMAADLGRPVAVTLGLGGGSLVRLDRSGGLVIGPQSAGAFPGPACYKLGGATPTLTDAYVVLGYLDEEYYLGGRKRISKDKAVSVIREKLAVSLGLSSEDAALEVKRQAVRVVGAGILPAVERTGLPVSDFTLVAVGGGGGCIGPDLFLHLGMKNMCFFRQGAVFGAYGSSGMDVLHVYEHRFDLPRFGDSALAERNAGAVNEVMVRLQHIACKDMRGEGFQSEEIRFEAEAELVPSAGAAPLRIKLPNPFLWPAHDWPVLAERVAEKLNDKNPRGWQQALLSRVFVRARAYVPRTNASVTPMATHGGSANKGVRTIYTDAGWTECPAYEWDLLSVPLSITGPAIVESADTTVVAPPGTVIELDRDFNGLIRRASRKHETANHRISRHRS